MWAPNVQFQIDDLEEDGTFRIPFNFIHCSTAIISFKKRGLFFKQARE
jgi:hypothetical protein